MEEDKGISRSNPPKILRLAERIDWVLMRYLRSETRTVIQYSTTDGLGDTSSSESPLSPAENLKTKSTPSVNVEEDVLEIDSITEELLVDEEMMMPEDSDSDAISELEGQFSQEKLELGPTHFHMRYRSQGNICMEFAVTGRCSLGPRCPFFHQPPLQGGAPPIEVVRPGLWVPSPLRPLPPQFYPAPPFLQSRPVPRPFFRPRLEERTRWPYELTGEYPRGPRRCYVHPPRAQGTPSPSRRTPSSTKDAAGTSTIAPTTTTDSNLTRTPATTTTTTTTTTADTKADWSPMDDVIEVTLPGSSSDNPPSREDVNTYVDRFLYDPIRPRRRLPVFQDICPDTDAKK